MSYMKREDRKDQIILAMLAALSDTGEYRCLGGQFQRGIKRCWTVSEIAREVGLVRSTRLHNMVDELAAEGSLDLQYHPYKSGGITNYRKVYQVKEQAYIQAGSNNG